MKLTTDFIRVAVEGTTADGREITASQIEQMAASYDSSVYDAKIWIEHIRSYAPDGFFKPLGRVIAAKAGRITDKSALEGKMALYAKLEPHPDLVAMVRNGQKVHASIEMHPKFPTTNGAYLMGLGVTDSPASLGTGIMQFSAASRGESVFSEPQALFSDSVEQEQPVDQPNQFSDMLGYLNAELKRVCLERDALRAAIKAAADKYTAEITAKDAEILELKKQIPADGYTFRPLFTGNEGLETVTGWR